MLFVFDQRCSLYRKLKSSQNHLIGSLIIFAASACFEATTSDAQTVIVVLKVFYAFYHLTRVQTKRHTSAQNAKPFEASEPDPSNIIHLQVNMNAVVYYLRTVCRAWRSCYQ